MIQALTGFIFGMFAGITISMIIFYFYNISGLSDEEIDNIGRQEWIDRLENECINKDDEERDE